MRLLFFKANFSFKSYYEIFSDYQHLHKIGELKESSWLSISYANLYGRSYAFKNQGVFSEKTDIISINTENYKEEKIGEITYSVWKSKANIELYKENYYFQFTNNWNTKYQVMSSINNSQLMLGENKLTKSKIEIFDENFQPNEGKYFGEKEIVSSEIQEILALSSVYTNNFFLYFIMMLSFCVIIFVSILN